MRAIANEVVICSEPSDDGHEAPKAKSKARATACIVSGVNSSPIKIAKVPVAVRGVSGGLANLPIMAVHVL